MTGAICPAADAQSRQAEGAARGASVPANRKAQWPEKAAANFAKLSRHQAMFTDESIQRLKQLDNNTNLDGLMLDRSLAGRVA